VEVRVRLGADLAGVAGTARLAVDLAEGATVADLLRQLGAAHPGLRGGLASALPVIAGGHVGPERRLAGGEEVALLLPAAGG
jgi:molybdopterin converting factor small subunit